MPAEENKRVARMYHDLNPDDVENILTPGFIGRHAPKRDFTWRRDAHKRFLTNNSDMKDTIHEQIAEGEWVATRFTRTGTYQGRYGEVDFMHLKRFEEGKIAELWEYFDSRELDE
jgi:ketosteroid isomerase-like protein